MRGLWREGGGGRARRVGGVAGEPACHPGARCRRLLRLGSGLGLQQWLGRGQASHRNGVPDGARTRSAQGGPTVPPQRPKFPPIRSKRPVSGVPLLRTQGGMVVVVGRGLPGIS